MNKYAIFIVIMTIFNVCYGMEKEPSLFDKFKGFFIAKPQTKNSSSLGIVESNVIGQECPVCLASYPMSEFVEGDCGHSFCSSCMGKWLVGEKNKSKNSCPLCRQDIIKVATSQSDQDQIKFLKEENNKHKKEINEQKIQINILERANDELCLVDQELKHKTEFLNDLIFENNKIAMIIHTGVFIRSCMPLFADKMPLLSKASLLNKGNKLLGMGVAQLLLLNIILEMVIYLVKKFEQGLFLISFLA